MMESYALHIMLQTWRTGVGIKYKKKCDCVTLTLCIMSFEPNDSVTLQTSKTFRGSRGCIPMYRPNPKWLHIGPQGCKAQEEIQDWYQDAGHQRDTYYLELIPGLNLKPSSAVVLLMNASL